MSAYGFKALAEAPQIVGGWLSTSSAPRTDQPPSDGDAPEYEADPVAANLGTCAGMVEQELEALLAQVGIAEAASDAAIKSATNAQAEADAAHRMAATRTAAFATLDTRRRRMQATLNAIRAAQRAASGETAESAPNGSGSPAALYGRDGAVRP